MVVLDTNYLQLNGESYRLARQVEGGQVGGRRWQVESKPQATTFIPREDVRPGQIEGEWTITWDDWSRGLTGEEENLLGGIFQSDRLHGLNPGSLRGIRSPKGGTASNEQVMPPARILLYDNKTFIIAGQYAYTYNGTSFSQDRDFGSGKHATDAIVHNNLLWVCFGGASSRMQNRDTAGTWADATDAVYADFLAHTEDRLWRVTATNEVSNCGPTDDPGLTASWSAGITVGDDDYGATSLSGYGERLAVAKVNGLFLGDRNAIFPNVFPQLENYPDRKNGRGMLVRGEDIFYPHANGLLRYNSQGLEEVGPEYHWREASLEDHVPNPEITALAVNGHYLWAATESTSRPRARVTGFQKTVNSGVAYTDYTSDVSDGSSATAAILNSLDTTGNGDWVIVGYSAPFYGIWLEMGVINSIAATLTAEYWNGSAWTAMPIGSAVVDQTSLGPVATPLTAGTITLSRSGMIRWANSGLSSWAASTINSINAYWIRLSVSAAISSVVEVTEAYVITEVPRSYLFRGRSSQDGDQRDASLVWEPMGYANANGAGVIGPTAIAVVNTNSPAVVGATLLVASRQALDVIGLPLARPDPGVIIDNTDGAQRAVVARHDAGMPNVNKQWTQFVVKGRGIDSARDFTLEYRVNTDTSWTSAGSITASPTTLTLSGVTGRSIQWRLTSNAYASDTTIYPEVNVVEAVFRPLYIYKNEYLYLIEVDDGQEHSGGGVLPDAAVQLSNLEALRGTAVAQVDPVGREKTVTVHEVETREVLQSDESYPILLSQVRTAEV